MVSNHKKLYGGVLFALSVAAALGQSLFVGAPLAAGQTSETSDYRLGSDGKTLDVYSGKGETFFIPDGIETIGSSAFGTAATLKSVVIPASVFEIRVGAFDGATSLTAFEVAEDNEFFVSKDGVLFSKDERTLVRYPAGLDKESYIVPSNVVKIADRAFALCSSPKEIVLPDGLVSIGDRAFSGCSSLEALAIPGGVSSLGENPFGGSSLASIEVAEDNPSFGSLDGVLFSKDRKTLIRRPHNKKGDSYVAPDGVETIAPFAFADCDSLKSIVLPEGLKSVGKTAFVNCAALETIRVPQSVERIEELAFDSCRALKTIDVAADNSAYFSVDGVLFTKDGTTLVKCPEGIEKENYVVPEGVTTIAAMAFSRCARLRSIVVSEGVKEFKPFAFQACESLKSVEVPESVAVIAFDCFPGQSPEFTVRGAKGSYAEEYAASRQLRFEAVEKNEDGAEEVVLKDDKKEDDGKAGVHIVVVVSAAPEFQEAALKWRQKVEGALDGSLDVVSSALSLSNFQTNMPVANRGGLGIGDVASYQVLEGENVEPSAVVQACRKISEEAKWRDAIAVFVFAPDDAGRLAFPRLDIGLLADALKAKEHRLVVVLEDLYSTSVDNFKGLRPTTGVRTRVPEFLPKKESYLKRFLTEAKGELFFRSTNFEQKALIETSVKSGHFDGSRFAAAFARFASNGCYLDSELNPVGFYNLLSVELCREILNYNRWSRDTDVQQSLTQVDASNQAVAIAPLVYKSLDDLWKADAARYALLKKNAEFSENVAKIEKPVITEDFIFSSR